MDEIKLREAFLKIREDIDYLYQEIQEIKRTLESLKSPTQNIQIQTPQHEIPTPQHPQKALKDQYLPVSIGNKGVPTNKPTNQQTIQHPPISTDKFALNKESDKIGQLQRASEILSSLDELKKEVRVKFKKLTNQEMLIFTIIYQLEDQNIPIDYTVVAEKTGLSEISVRDYIRKIIKKGIPIDKIKKENNKITLSISKDLRKITSLNTIIQLREL